MTSSNRKMVSSAWLSKSAPARASILYWPGGTSKLMRRPHTGRCRTSSRACWPPGRHDQVRRSRRLPNHQIGSHPDPFDQLTRWIEEFINLENIEPILTQNIEN